MRNSILVALMLFVYTVTPIPSFAQDDWQVTTSTSAKLAYKYQGLYSGIKTQEAWDKEFKKVFDKGDVAASRFLIAHAKKLELQFDVNTLLHKAVTLKTSAMAQMLLAQGADPTAKDSSGNQALHLAVKSLSVKNVELLLKRADVNVDAENGQGERAIGLAVASNDGLMVKQVLKRRPNLDFKLWGTEFKEWVLKKDNVAGFKLFNPNLNAKKLPLDDEGQTVLHKAAKYDASRITTYLLTKGANPRVRAGKAPTAGEKDQRPIPFDYAVTSGHVNTIRAYLEHDKKFVNFRDQKTGDSLLHVAFDTGNWELADLVMKLNPSFSERNYKREYLADTLKRVKEGSDLKDVETAKNITKYEVILSKKRATAEKVFAHAIKLNDAALFEKYVNSLELNEFWHLFNTALNPSMTPRLKLSMFKVLVKAGKQLLDSPWTLYNRPQIFSPENLPYFKVFYETLGGSSLHHCDDSTCPLIDALADGPPELIKFFLRLKPPVSFNGAYSFSYYINRDQRPSYLDRLDKRLENIKSSDNGVLTQKLSHLRQLLVKQGALTGKEQDSVVERAVELIKAGRGKDLLTKYKPEQLARLSQGTVLRHAVFYNDEALVKALLPYSSNDAYLSVIGTFAKPAIKKLLNKFKLISKAPVNCATVFDLYHNRTHKEQLIKAIKYSQLESCRNVDLILTSAISNYSDGVFDALLEIPSIQKELRTPHLSSPIHSAIYKCDRAAINKMLAAGADPNFSDLLYGTPLISLGTRSCAQAAEIATDLIAAGADVNRVAMEWTSLRAAVGTKNYPLFKALIDAGADLYPSEPGKTQQSFSASEQIVLPPESAFDQLFWDYLYEKGIDPVRIRQCETWDHPSLSIMDDGRYDILNAEILRFRKKQTDAQNEASCESLKTQIETQYTRDVLIFSQHVEKWKQSLNTYSEKHNANANNGLAEPPQALDKLDLPTEYVSNDAAFGSMCCGYTPGVRCSSQLVCDSKKQARESAAIFCDRFADSPTKLRTLGHSLERVKVSALKASSQNLIKKHHINVASAFRIGVLDSMNSTQEPLVELFIPLDADEKTTKIIFDEQTPGLYSDVGLDSLHSYVAWKYPHCADHFPVGSKLSTEKLNKTILPQKSDAKRSVTTEGTNAK